MISKAIILIVDDVASNIQVLEAILKNDYEIKVAINGKRALEIMSQEPIPDLVLLDVQMPELNGYEVLKKLQSMEHTRNIPVIFITGNDSSEEEEEGLELGAVDYITKPIHPAIVKVRIKTQIKLKKYIDNLAYIALHDKLTGLFNRHYLEETGKSKFASAKRHGDDMSIIMCDLDHFKNINDTHGHLNGDKVLQKMGHILQENIRTDDFSSRYGGEEFVIILWKCNAESARIKANEIRMNVFHSDVDSIKVTASFGVVQIKEEHLNFEALLKDADKALYRAKKNGRNRVEVF